jgi:hypothetical protein
VSTIPPIQVKVEADTTGLTTGLDKAKAGIKDVDDSVKTASTGMKNFTATLKSVGSAMGIAFAGAQVANFAKESIMAASDMQESMSKVKVVFGDSSDAVIAFSKTAATSIGMSSQQALEATGTYGNLFQALGVGKDKAQEMSVNMTKLAADLGSFNNMSVTDSLNALRSGLSGETEPLKRFGVSLNDTILKQKAFEMGFGKIVGAMDPAIKSQVIYATVMEQTKKAQGDYARTADGTANTMKTLQAKFEDAKVAVGDALMPAFRALLAVLNAGIPILEKIGKFFQDNQREVKAFAITVGALAIAWGAYKVVVNAATIAQKALNAAQKINPMGVLIITVGLLVAAMVKLWNNSEDFRKIVVEIGKVGLAAIGALIKIVGVLVTGMMKVVTGPLRLLLKGLALLGNKDAKKALDGINESIESTGKFFDDAAKKVTSYGAELDKAVAKSDKAAKATKASVEKTKGGTEEVTKKTTKSAADTKAEEKRLKDITTANKKVADVYADMNKAIKEANDDAAEALARRDERIADARTKAAEDEMDARSRFSARVTEATERAAEAEAEARERFNERVADATKKAAEAEKASRARYAEQMAEADERYLEKTAEAYEKQKKTEIDVTKRYNKAKLDIETDYAKKTADLKSNLAKKLEDIQQAADKKSVDATKKAADKQQSIIQQSIDRLRSAFASKTGFSIGDSFKEGGSADSLLNDLKAKLLGAKTLQSNAAALAGMGYSQTFIEEVVKNGPEAGNKIADALKAASPEATAQLQSLYGEVENVSAHGLDALAQTMNSGGRLATQELMNAYDQVAIDLTESLAEINAELTEKLADANAAYEVAMTEAKVVRDEKLADATATLKEAIAESQKELTEALAAADAALKKAQLDAKKQLDDSLAEIKKSLDAELIDAQKDLDKTLADIQKTLKKALIDAQKDLDDTLEDIQKTLQKTLADAQKDYEKTIEDINKAISAKIADMKTKLTELAATLTSLKAKQDAIDAIQNAPAFTPIIGSTIGGGATMVGGTVIPATTGLTGSKNSAVVVNQTYNVTSVDPYDVKLATIAGIKFGTTVVGAPATSKVINNTKGATVNVKGIE